MTVTVWACPADAADGRAFDDGAACGREFTSKNGAVMHALNTDDDHHAVIGSKPEGYDNLEAVTASVGDPTDDVDGKSGGRDRGSSPPDPDADDGPTDTDRGSSRDVMAPEIPEAETDDTTDGPDGAACPECGEPLGVTEAEAERVIREHGAAECDECGARLEVAG